MRKILFLVLAVLLLALPVAAEVLESSPALAVAYSTTGTIETPAKMFGNDWVECAGVRAYAKAPFRYISYDASGGTNATYCPVDTLLIERTNLAGSVEYPVVLNFHAPLDSIRFKPTTSDTIWYHLLWEKAR